MVLSTKIDYMRYCLLITLFISFLYGSAAEPSSKRQRRGLFGRKAKQEQKRDTVFQEIIVRDTIYIRNHFPTFSVLQNQINDSIPEEFSDKMDYLTHLWYLSMEDEENILTETYFKENLPVEVSDSVYLQRLDDLKSAVPLSYNHIVKKYIELYTKRGRAQTARMLGLSEYYFPIFEEILDKHDMPLELKYLPVIESALNPTAFSKAGACGLWQFMYATGRMYKLEINSYIDERRDPIRSTEAAVLYLKDLYKIYENWMLVIAAYNCGPGNVNKAIRRSGGYKNYWDVYYHLPRETRGYIPAFIGAMYAFEYHKEHNILPMSTDLPFLCDSLEVNDLLHFEQLAAKLNIPVEELRTLNPQYRADAIPGSADKGYILQLPYDRVADFIDHQDTIFAYNKTKYFDLSDRKADPGNRIKIHAKALGSNGGERIVYTVKSGDVPGAIASRFKVRLVDMRYWNSLNKRMTIRPGQKLVLYVSKSVAANYRGKGNSTSTSSNDKITYENLEDGSYEYYTVRKGDNLWQIAQKFPGISDRDIMRWNGITQGNLKNIKPGLKLKIKKQ